MIKQMHCRFYPTTQLLFKYSVSIPKNSSCCNWIVRNLKFLGACRVRPRLLFSSARLPVSRRRPLGRERGLQRTGRRPLLPGDLPPTPCLHFLQGATQDDACSAPEGERLGQEERGQRRLLRRRRSPTSLSRLPQRFSSSKAQVRTPGLGPQWRPLLNRGGFFFPS